MKVFIRESAEEDLDRIFAWIAKDNPRAATELLKRIQDKVNRLEIDSLVHMGRKGLVEGTRELIEYPYIIVYEVDDSAGEVTVLAIVYGARNRRS